MTKAKQLTLPMERPEETIRLPADTAREAIRSMVILVLQVLDAEEKEGTHEPRS